MSGQIYTLLMLIWASPQFANSETGSYLPKPDKGSYFYSCQDDTECKVVSACGVKVAINKSREKDFLAYIKQPKSPGGCRVIPKSDQIETDKMGVVCIAEKCRVKKL